MQFPIQLVPPSTFRWAPQFKVGGGESPVWGSPQTGNLSAGSLWTCSHDRTVLRGRGRPDYNAWYATLGKAMRAGHFDVRWLANAHAPWPAGVRHGAPPATPAGLGFFVDETPYVTYTIDAELALHAEAGDTEITVQMNNGGVPVGGEALTLVGASGLARLHLVSGVSVVSGDHYLLEVDPELREDYAVETFVDFERPRCSMHIPLEALAEAFPTVSLPGVLAEPVIRFEEYWPLG